MGWVRRYLWVVGSAAVLGSCAALVTPLQLDAYDHGGTRLACGSTLHPGLAAAYAEDQHNHDLHAADARLVESTYAFDCSTWITRKRWAATGVVGSALVLIGLTELATLSVRRRIARLEPPDRTFLPVPAEPYVEQLSVPALGDDNSTSRSSNPQTLVSEPP